MAPSPAPRVTHDHRRHAVHSRNGLELFVRDWGPEDGPVVIFHHGTPGSSLGVPGGWNAPGETGVRVLTFDRPGYGRSPARSGRTVGDSAAWTSLVADALGLEQFALMGVSSGGAHAAAAAALLGERVTKLCVAGGIGPDELPGFDPAAGAIPVLQQEIACARAGDGALRRFIAEAIEHDEPLDAWFSQLLPADVEILGRGDVRAEEQAARAEAMRQGPAGWLEDDLALFHRPWRCDLAAITAQTLLLYGLDDVLVPAEHGDAYRLAIGHGQLLKLPSAGHWLRDYEPGILSWLAAPDEEPASVDL